MKPTESERARPHDDLGQENNKWARKITDKAR